MLTGSPICRWGAARVLAAASHWLGTPACSLVATPSPLGRVTPGLWYRWDVVRSLLTTTPATSLGTARVSSRHPVYIVRIFLSLHLQGG